MARLVKLGVLSVAKFQGALMAVFGLILGIFYSVFALMIGGADDISGGMFAGIGTVAVLMLPLVYGILGFMVGGVTALLYNWVSKFLGGIELEISQK